MAQRRQHRGGAGVPRASVTTPVFLAHMAVIRPDGCRAKLSGAPYRGIR